MTINLEEEIKKKLREVKNNEYGDYKTNFTVAANLWSMILRKKLKVKLSAHEVAMCMVLFKIMRTAENYKADSYLDASIYLDMAKELHKNIDKKE